MVPAPPPPSGNVQEPRELPTLDIRTGYNSNQTSDWLNSESVITQGKYPEGDSDNRCTVCMGQFVCVRGGGSVCMGQFVCVCGGGGDSVCVGQFVCVCVGAILYVWDSLCVWGGGVLYVWGSLCMWGGGAILGRCVQWCWKKEQKKGSGQIVLTDMYMHICVWWLNSTVYLYVVYKYWGFLHQWNWYFFIIIFDITLAVAEVLSRNKP